LEDDDDLEEELDLKPNLSLITIDHSGRPDTNASTDSQKRGDSKRLRSKHSHRPILGFSANNLKRDPTIDSIIESRKSSIIENAYTCLAQTTSQLPRSSQNIRINSVKTHVIVPKTAAQVHFNEMNNQIMKSENDKRSSLTSALQFDNDRWDDGLNGDFDKG